MEDEHQQKTPPASVMGGSSFGVQSLEETISSAYGSESSPSRSNSNSTESQFDGGVEGSVVQGRKRKARNPVHPKIAAAGQRIISTEQPSTHASLSASPVSLRSAESPYRSRSHVRRNSAASSINLSQPMTPLKMSPQPASALPSTPRSGSPKSFRLSDEEASVADETGSQAVQSSSGEEDEEVALSEDTKDSSMPQLVMPSIAVPTRRPFTERGKRMGRLRVMVVGPQGIGKTSLINSIFRTCEDIVHVDPVLGSKPGDTFPLQPGQLNEITETTASTRPYPSWWTDFQSRRMLHSRRSIGSDSVLERNLSFIEVPGINTESNAKQAVQYVDGMLRRTANTNGMHDSELINLLSGDGGIQIDAVLWLFASAQANSDLSPQPLIDGPQQHLLRYLAKVTNVIPLIGQADTAEPEELAAQKKRVLDLLKSSEVEHYSFLGQEGKIGTDSSTEAQPSVPFHVSSALGDDAETIDASLLMSSQYLQPLVPSELGYFVHHLLDPINIARMRHLAATKFLLWRQEHLSSNLDLQKVIAFRSPRFTIGSPAVTTSGSMPDEPSKVLVPHSSSSYYRSISPSASDTSAVSGNVVEASAYALAHHNQQANTGEPFRQVRLAKWAQDLQRSLANERRRYTKMYMNPPADWTSEDGEKSDKALVTAHDAERPQRGRLGGDIAIIDPRDPLGVLAFSQTFRRRGWFALQLAGGCGLVGAVAFWVMRNWIEVQEFFNVGQPPVIQAPAIAAPTRGMLAWLDDGTWRGFFGWDR